MRKIVELSIIGAAFFLPLSSGIVNSLMGVAMAFWILDKIFSKDLSIRPTALNLPLVLFFAISCVSIINSIEPATSVKGLIKVLKYLGIYFLMTENISDIRLARRIITALILGAAVVCLDGVFQYVTGRDLLRSNPLIINVGLKRMTAAYRHCNDFGVYLATIAPVIWSLGLYEKIRENKGKKGRIRVFLLVAAGLITLCIMLTFSRGAALAFYGAAAAIGIVKKDRVVLAVLALSLLCMPFLIPKGVSEWGRTTKSPLEFFCNNDRISFYRSAVRMIKAHPFIGSGINTFMKAYPRYKVRDMEVITAEECYAHNNYLQMAGEIGLVGLGIFLWILAAFFIEVIRIIRKDKDKEGYIRNAALGLGCGIFAFLLNGLTESSFYFSKIVVVFWFVAGLAVSMKFIKE
jgi:O-antigen ligase